MLACQHNRYCDSKFSSGMAALPAILLISGIIFSMVIMGAFLAFSFTRGSFGVLLATQALAGARAGSDDAVYRIIKNNYLSSYSFSSADVRPVMINVVIERDPADLGACAIAWGCRYRIRSTGRILFRERRVEVILSVNPHTREIRRESFREIET